MCKSKGMQKQGLSLPSAPNNSHTSLESFGKSVQKGILLVNETLEYLVLFVLSAFSPPSVCGVARFMSSPASPSPPPRPVPPQQEIVRPASALGDGRPLVPGLGGGLLLQEIVRLSKKKSPRFARKRNLIILEGWGSLEVLVIYLETTQTWSHGLLWKPNLANL